MQVIHYSFISDYSCICTADQRAVVIYIFCAAANTCLFLVTLFRLINRSGIVEFLNWVKNILRLTRSAKWCDL